MQSSSNRRGMEGARATKDIGQLRLRLGEFKMASSSKRSLYIPWESKRMHGLNLSRHFLVSLGTFEAQQAATENQGIDIWMVGVVLLQDMERCRHDTAAGKGNSFLQHCHQIGLFNNRC